MQMASSSLSLLHHLHLNLVIKPSVTATLLLNKPLSLTPLTTIIFPPCNNKSRLFCNSSSSSSLLLESSQVVEEEDGDESQIQPQQKTEETPVSTISSIRKSALKLPNLSVKEKKELTAYAHTLGKKLKVQQVGKWGVTDSVAAAFVENLESNELLKLKIQNNCQAELPEVIKLLEEKTGSVAIGQIGRTVILYRPSLTKLKAEEKKKEAQRIHARRVFRPRPTEFRVKSTEYRSKPEENEQVEKKRRPAPKLSSRGRRGTSRNELP